MGAKGQTHTEKRNQKDDSERYVYRNEYMERNGHVERGGSGGSHATSLYLCKDKLKTRCFAGVTGRKPEKQYPQNEAFPFHTCSTQ